MSGDERTEGRGIGKRAAQDARVGNRAVAIGEGDGAGFAEQANLGHALALERVGEGGHRRDADLCSGGSAALDEIHQRGLIDHRIGVGHGDDGGDAARRCRFAGGSKRLAMLAAGFARKDAHVDQARREDETFAVDHFWIVRIGGVEQLGADIGDPAILDEQPTACVEAGRWVDQARVSEGEAPHFA